MALLKFRKVTSLPGTLEADAFYFVVNSGYAESYVTDSSGNGKAIGNSAMINTLADARIASAIASFNALEIVANIAARNALAVGANRNFMVLVTDATGDATVASGAALYAFNNATDTFSKLSEYESMDVVVTWSSITGKPSSSPSAIDAAVAASHTHSNMSTLNKLSEDSDGLLFNGAAIAARWNATNW
jgi:hypothetical protein